MVKHGLSSTEKIILFLVLAIVAAGHVLFHTNLSLFEQYIQEDGFVEWLTVLGLILGCVVCVSRFTVLRKYRSWWFLFVVLDLALLLFFAAGEEISWGQRILGIKSSEFFKEHNAQGETNFHNLVVGGKKLNKIIFSIGLIAVLAIYLLLMPVLYRSSDKIKQWINKSGIPIAQWYQVISIVVLFGLTELIPHGKKAEISEAGIALLFFLIIRHPLNSYIFRRDQLV